jgi:hypothetical protein
METKFTIKQPTVMSKQFKLWDYIPVEKKKHMTVHEFVENLRTVYNMPPNNITKHLRNMFTLSRSQQREYMKDTLRKVEREHRIDRGIITLYELGIPVSL